MRRGTWILAVAGALSLQSGDAGAAEPGMPKSPYSSTIPSRYTRSNSMPGRAPAPPAATSSANLYDELFGDVKLNSDKTAASSDQRPASAPPVREAVLKDQAVVPAGKTTVADEAKQSEVIHAAFDDVAPNGTSYIQPVRATAEAPNTPRTATTALPSAQTPNVVVDWVKKSDINVGQECELHLVAKNSGTGPAAKVVLEAVFPSTVRLTSAEPKPESTADKLVWKFDSLPAGSEKKIAIKLIPSRRGDLGTSAQVSFSSQAAAVFKVEEPLLKVEIRGPKEILLGDPASQMITISNPGSGVAHNVKLEALLSEGLEHPHGERLNIEIGSIGPGDSQTVRLGLSAAKGGPQSIQVTASSSCDASATTMEKINIIAPSLSVAATGPGLRYVGRAATYNIDVTNDGTVANNNVRVSHRVPEGFQFVSANRGGKYDASQRTIHWFLGRLEGGQKSQVSCELTAISAGDFQHAVSVYSDSGIRADQMVATSVKGVAALSTEIVDFNDPIEVGVETAWEVRVRNDGSKAAKNIAVACELPAEVQLLVAKGPTQAVADQRLVVFRALPELAPGQQAIFRIQVKGVVDGTHRLRTRVTSDALDEPLLMEEATKFYSDTRK